MSSYLTGAAEPITITIDRIGNGYIITFGQYWRKDGKPSGNVRLYATNKDKVIALIRNHFAALEA